MDKLNHFLSIDIYSASELAVEGTRYFNKVRTKGLLFIAIHGGVCALEQAMFCVALLINSTADAAANIVLSEKVILFKRQLDTL